jgi:enoyl-CoA hydratase/carnithine racemase
MRPTAGLRQSKQALDTLGLPRDARTSTPKPRSGLQHLARLLGRGRALEVVLGADDYDADTAAAYGWINRALPDSELEPFVTRLARRIARFPAEGLLACKERVNAITLASEAEFRHDSDLFGRGVTGAHAQARIRALMSRGLQTRGETERDIGRILGELEDE